MGVYTLYTDKLGGRQCFVFFEYVKNARMKFIALPFPSCSHIEASCMMGGGGGGSGWYLTEKSETPSPRLTYL